MTIQLPQPIATYFAAEGAARPEALAACLAPDAVVLDEGGTIEGIAAIIAWQTASRAKYQHTTQPLRAIEQDGRTVVTARVAGHFPNSPVELDFAFRLEGERIAALEIR